MIKKYKSLLLLITLFLFLDAQSATPYGGEMSYRHLTGDKYEVKAIVYRDCRSSALGINDISFGVYGGLNGAKSCSTYSLTFTRSKIEDISPICSTGTKPCSPQNSAAGNGIEAHTFLDTIDFGSSPYSAFKNSSCCEVTFYANMCCRSKALTTGGSNSDFYITSTINLCNLGNCNATTNSSAEWTLPPIFSMCVNQNVDYTNGLADTFDHDRMVIATVAPISALPSTPITYTGSFTEKFPITPFCIPAGTLKCTPNTKTTPARGFFHDSIYDHTFFTPTNSNENAILAYECVEYRRDKNNNWVWIGKIRREFIVIVKDNCGYSKSPRVYGSTQNTVCAGDKICFKISSNDETYTPYQTLPDTVISTWNGTIKKGTFTVTNPTDREKNSDFCWQTTANDASEIPYRFTAIANDQHCDYPQSSRITFLVTVSKKTKGSMSGKVIKCDDIEFNIVPDSTESGAFTHSTILKNKNNLPIANSAARKGSFVNLDSGVYYLTTTLMQTGKCAITLNDTITVSKTIGSNISGTSTICKNTTGIYTANTLNASGAISYSWSFTKDGAIIGQSDTVHTKNQENLYLSIIDGQDCKASDSIKINILALPTIRWDRKPLYPICNNSTAIIINDFIIEPNSNTLNKGTLEMWGEPGVNSTNGLVEKYTTNTFLLNPALINVAIGSGTTISEKIQVMYTDSNGCVSKDSNTIRIHAAPIVELTDKNYCQNINSPIALNQIVVRPKSTFGTNWNWDIAEAPAGVDTTGMLSNTSGNDWHFNPGNPGDNSKAGNYSMALTVMDNVTGCKNKDTCNLFLLAKPELTSNPQNIICQDLNAQLDLYNQVLVDNNRPSEGTAYFSLVSINGNFDSSTWPKNIILSKRYFQLNAAPGLYQIKVQSLETGCESISTFTIKLNPTPESSFSLVPTDSVEISNPVFVTQNTSKIADNSALSYTWIFGDGNTSTIFAPVIQYPSVPAAYSLQLISKSTADCRDTSSKVMIVYDKTAGGTNDLHKTELKFDNSFKLNISADAEIELWIFDTSGKLVHHTWKNEGVELPPGIYNYMASIGKTGTKPAVIKGKHLIH